MTQPPRFPHEAAPMTSHVSRDTPPAGIQEIRNMGPEERSIYAAEAAKEAAEEAAQAKRIAERNSFELRALKVSVDALTRGQAEHRKTVNEQIDRLEGRVLEEFGRQSRAVGALEELTERLERALEKRASRGEEFLEEAARAALARRQQADEEAAKDAAAKREAAADKRKAVLGWIGGALGAGGVIAVAVGALIQGC